MMEIPPLPGHPRFRKSPGSMLILKGTPEFNAVMGNPSNEGEDWYPIKVSSGLAFEYICCIARCWWLDNDRLEPSPNAQAWADYLGGRMP